MTHQRLLVTSGKYAKCLDIQVKGGIKNTLAFPMRVLIRRLRRKKNVRADGWTVCFAKTPAGCGINNIAVVVSTGVLE